MNVSYGGNVPTMRKATVTEVGPYHTNTMLQVGYEQSLVFVESNAGPFWMTEEKR